MSHRTRILFLPAALALSAAILQAQSPSVSQVLMYSATTPSLTSAGVTLHNPVPNIFTEWVTPAELTHLFDTPCGALCQSTGQALVTGSNYGTNNSFAQVSGALNASIATALSIIPLSSPASGVISRTDPATGLQLSESSTLGPIFTERAETIGKGRFYIGFSNQDYHFTRFNGTSLNALNILYPGKQGSNIFINGTQAQTVPASWSLGMDVRLSQNIAFLTYGITDRFDISLGLPVVHAAAASRVYNAQIYAGSGFNPATGGNCWCVNTFTPGDPTLIQYQVNQTSASKTGFGDLLLRAKGTVFRSPGVVVGVGADLRFPTGDEQNYLGVGTTSVKPFVAVSFYSKPLAHGIVFSPHFDAGWQFSGKSILGGALQGTTVSSPISYVAAPFKPTKDFIPDVFNWAVGMELAVGRRNTFVADIIGNQIGWIHGIPDTMTTTLQNLALPSGPKGDPSGATPKTGSVTGLVPAGNCASTTNICRVSMGQYIGSFGFKVKVAGNLIANFNILTRFDNNGLTARIVPLFGLGYSF